MTAIDESQTAKGFTPAALVPQVFGQPRTIDGIVIHHWGALGQTHDGVVNFFVNGPGQTSAHFVASAGRINCIVSPLDAAWHSGNAVGNATTIGIECRPEATDGDYETVAELVRFLRGKYGPLPLSPHRQWQSTACPGVWDLNRIDQLAGSAAVQPQGTTTPEGFLMALSDEEQKRVLAAADRINGVITDEHAKVLTTDDLPAIGKAVLESEVTWYGFDGKTPESGRTTTSPRIQLGWADTNTAGLQAALVGLTEIVKQLSVQQGVTIDYDKIAKAVNDDAAKRMEG